MDISMASFVDEMLKLAATPAPMLERIVPWVSQKLIPGAKPYVKPGLLVGAGGTGVLGGQRVLENMSMAEQMRAMQAERGG